jgi:hypothetical protein
MKHSFSSAQNRLLESGTFFRIGFPPYQVVIFPEIPGVEFEACWPNRTAIALDAESSLRSDVISPQDLIAAKLASGRAQDLADVQGVRNAQAHKPRS